MFNLAHLDVTFIVGNLSFGGAERQLFYIVRALREAGAEVRVLCLTRGDYWEERLRELGAAVTWVGQRTSRAARLGQILWELQRHRPTLVQSHHFYTNLYAVVAARMLRLREVGAVRNDGYTDVAFTGRLGPLCLRLPRLIAANSKAGVRNSIALGVPANRVRLLPNVIDTGGFAAPARQPAGAVRLLTIGTRPEKRIDRFLEVVRQVRARSTVPVTAVVAGDAPERASYEQRASQLGLLPDVVRFAGALTNTASAYRDADVFVLTSEHEGTPNVLLEAMAAGLPVVVYRTGGVPEVVRAGTGLLADVGDEMTLVKHVTTLSGNPELRRRMGDQARTYVKAKYCVTRLPRILSNFYEAVLS